jgi:hypothetical protein
MIYPCKLNIHLNFQRLSNEIGERVANGNQGMFAYKISAFSPGSLRFNGSFPTQRPAEDRRETPRLLKLVDSLSCDN